MTQNISKIFTRFSHTHSAVLAHANTVTKALARNDELAVGNNKFLNEGRFYFHGAQRHTKFMAADCMFLVARHFKSVSSAVFGVRYDRYGVYLLREFTFDIG